MSLAFSSFINQPPQTKILRNLSQKGGFFPVSKKKASSNSRTERKPQAQLFNQKSSSWGNPKRSINYASRVFTTDVVNIDNHLDDVEEIILKHNKRPRNTEKQVRIRIDLNEKYKSDQMTQKGGAKQLDIYSTISKVLYGVRLQTQFEKTDYGLPRMSAASTKINSNNNRGYSASSQRQQRLYSAKSSQQFVSPLSMNFASPSPSILNDQERQTIIPQQSHKTLKQDDYQEFFTKNQNKTLGIAQYVIKGTKIQAKDQQLIQKEDQNNKSNESSIEKNVQTEQTETLSDCDFVDNNQPSNQGIKVQIQKKQKGSHLIYQGAHVKVFSPPVEVILKERPMSATPVYIKDYQKLEKLETSKVIEESSKDLDDTSPKSKKNESFQRFDISKFDKQFQSEKQLHRSIFREKQQKIMELSDYLQLILYDYQQERFSENQEQIYNTLMKYNIPESIQSLSLSDSKQGYSISQDDIHPQVQQTTQLLRQLTGKSGPQVELISHGLQHFFVQDIEQFFDPAKLKLKYINLSDIPYADTKLGSHSFFVKGFQLYQEKRFQEALNTYEDGIKAFPDNSYNCKFNKGVTLFELGIYNQSLEIYREIFKEQPYDKRICYNKAICEIYNSMYHQSIYTIDSYVNDFNRRQSQLEADESLTSEERSLYLKPNNVPNNSFLFEVFKLRGVACLKSQQLQEASKSFSIAQQFKNITAYPYSKKQPSQEIDDGEYKELSEINLEKQGEPSIKFENQDKSQRSSVNIKIRPMTAKIRQSQSNISLPQTLESLVEEEVYEQEESSIPNVVPEKQDDLFSLDADSMMRALDDYDQEHQVIRDDLKTLSKVKTQNKLLFNRNINMNKERPHTAAITPQNFQFSNVNPPQLQFSKPQGAIAQFISNKESLKTLKRDRKQFDLKIKKYDLSSLGTQQETRLNSKKSSFDQQMQGENYDPEIESEIFMKHKDYYIDADKKIRLDKVLLGFELDILNDSITNEELAIREKRQKIQEEYEEEQMNKLDPLIRKLQRQQQELEAQIKKDNALQFLEIYDKDIMKETRKRLINQNTINLKKLQQGINQLSKMITNTYNDPSKTELQLDERASFAMDVNDLLRTPSQNQSMHSLEGIGQAEDEGKAKKLKLVKRIKMDQVNAVVEELQKPIEMRQQEVIETNLGKLKFFIKFPLESRRQLYDLAVVRIFNKGEVIFKQGEKSEDFFIIIRGTVCIKVVKEEMGNLEVNTKVCYDGDYIGELAHFQVSESLSLAVVNQLNRQRVTTIAEESPCILLQLDKVLANQIMSSPELQSKYEDRINFLRKIDIFEDIDLNILLPLASSIHVKHYNMGEYLVKEGELPAGLLIIKEGQCIVAAEKIAMRSSKPTQFDRLQAKNPDIMTNPTGSSNIVLDKEKFKKKNARHKNLFAKNTQSSEDMMKCFSESLNQLNTHKKAYQNEKILVDDKGKTIRDFTVFKDLMIFFHLLPKSYFGGRVLLPNLQKKQTADGEKDFNQISIFDEEEHYDTFFAGSTNEDNLSPINQGLKAYEHFFFKRHKSTTTRKILQNNRSSMLSVIAHSSSVEVYLIDRQLLEFFPEHIQKHIWNKVMHVFEPDRPYMLKNVQKIKDKFKEWDVYKVKSVEQQMKNMFYERKAEKLKINI